MPRLVASFDCTADCFFARTRRVVEPDRALETSTSIVCGLCSIGWCHSFVREGFTGLVALAVPVVVVLAGLGLLVSTWLIVDVAG